MSDESTKTAADGGDAAAGTQELPTEVTLKVRGKSLPMTLEKALTLAQQGLVQQQNAEHLAAERKAFEDKATRYAEFEKFTGHLNGHPDAAQAVALALQDPQSVLSGGTKPKRETREEPIDDFSDRDGDDASGRQNGADEGLRNELLALKQTIARLEAKDTQRDTADAEGVQSTAIDREIADYPWLKAPKMAALAKMQIANALAAKPGNDLASVTAIVASDFKEAFADEATERAETARRKTHLRTERPARGTPIPGMKKPPTKEDLMSGKLMEPLKAMARSFGMPVD